MFTETLIYSRTSCIISSQDDHFQEIQMSASEGICFHHARKREDLFYSSMCHIVHDKTCVLVSTCCMENAPTEM